MSQNVSNFFSIPIFIISYNRKNDLSFIVKRLLKDGYTNLIILDNASTESGLIEYLRHIKDERINVVFLEKNYGHGVLWECHQFDDIIESQYYVLTDPDVFPINDCPNNYVEVFYDILQKYPDKTKVGFSLKIDDLPNSYPFKYDIIRFESFYWEKKLPYFFDIYDAPIDTTFALYKPGIIDKRKFCDAIRTGGEYVARHNGWYVTEQNQNSEYFKDGNISSTAMNSQAMRTFQLVVISNLLSKQNEGLYYITHRILPNNKIKNNYTFFDIFRTFIYLLRKKISLYIFSK